MIQLVDQNTVYMLNLVHSNSIIHRDIKTDNILVNEEGVCKLSMLLYLYQLILVCLLNQKEKIDYLRQKVTYTSILLNVVKVRVNTLLVNLLIYGHQVLLYILLLFRSYHFYRKICQTFWNYLKLFLKLSNIILILGQYFLRRDRLVMD